MSPVVDGLAEQYGNRIAFQRLNAAREGKIDFEKYRLRGHPAYVILDKQGQAVWQAVGQVPRADLAAALERILQPGNTTSVPAVRGTRG